MGRPPIRPVVWSPPPAPTRPGSATASMPPPRLLPVGGIGPEDVAVEPGGSLVTGVEDGRVLRIYPDDGRIEVIATTRGRPLGIEVTDAGLVVCDAYDGLLRVHPRTGVTEPLLERDRVHLCNNAAVASDGTIYLSDSSQRFALSHYRADIIEHSGTGRLLRRDPDGRVEVLLAGLQFANGVALAADESFVVVAETGAYRLRRVWLTGPRAGDSDVFTENLPGFPDNVSTGAGGRFWVAMFSPRNALLDWAHGKHPLLRRAIWALPEAVQPQPERTAWVLALDSAGAVVADLQRPGDGIQMVTGVREHAGRLYLGSLYGDVIAVVDLPARPTDG
jgi:sugar lactone lactonase YvrE